MKKVILVLLLSIPAYAFALDVRYCTGDSVRVRSDHSTSASVLATMNKGTAFNIVGTSDRKETIQDKTDFWYKIVTENNVTGWVFGAFVSDSGKKSSDKLSGVIVGSEYVITNAWIFPEPKIDWEKRITLQYRSKVKVMEKATQISSAMNQLGHWTKIQCGNINGWTLDSFLTTCDDINGRNASMYNVCLFNDSQISGLLESECKECTDYAKKLDCYNSLDISGRKFNPPPEFAVGEEILLISNNGITSDKVKSLKLEYSESTGSCYLRFTTENVIKALNSSYKVGLYMNKKRIGSKIPRISTAEIVSVDPSAMDTISFHIQNSEMRPFKVKTPAEIRKLLKSDFSVTCRKLNSPGASGYSVYEFVYKGKEMFVDSFTAFFYRTELLYCNFSGILSVFTIDGKTYLPIDEWIPNSGCNGRKLFLLEEGMLKVILSEFYFSD